jgi:uncharacterized protein YchJ
MPKLDGYEAVQRMAARHWALVTVDCNYRLEPRGEGCNRADSHQFADVRLSIIDTRVTGDASAEVEFIARSRVSNAAAVRQHERGRFVREGGGWFYLDGDLLERRW